jgi:hypothetical protein
MAVIAPLKRMRQEHSEFKANLGYTASSILLINKTKQNKTKSHEQNFAPLRCL